MPDAASDRVASDLFMDSENIALHLPLMAAQQPETLAVVVQTRARDFPSYTYAELDQASDELARGLQAAGVVKGTRTALMLPPGRDFFALAFALFKIGAILIAIDPGMGLRQLGRCLAEAEPQAFIGNRRAHIARRLLAWARPSIRITIVVEPWRLFGYCLSDLPLIRRLAADSPLPAMNPTHHHDLAAILFTSGSTGVPKGVIYTHANFNAQVKAIRTLYDIRPGEVDLATFPLFALFAPALGMTAIIPAMDFSRPGRVDPDILMQAVDRFQPTTMFGSPALLNRLGDWLIWHKKNMLSLKRVLSAGAPVPVEVLRKLSPALDAPACIHTPYGATEALPVCSIDSQTVLDETGALTRQGKGICIGPPVAGITLHIIGITDEAIDDWRDDLPLPAYATGEIVVQGEQVTAGYYHRQQATALAKIPAGDSFYHRMGDLGYLDEQGRVWFCGRKSHRVESQGMRYYSVCCEAVFNTHAHVFRTALIPLQIGGATLPALCVELEAGIKRVKLATIVDELLALGAGTAQTARIKHFFFHPQFPVDVRHNAKIDREQLAAWAQRQMR